MACSRGFAHTIQRRRRASAAITSNATSATTVAVCQSVFVPGISEGLTQSARMLRVHQCLSALAALGRCCCSLLLLLLLLLLLRLLLPTTVRYERLVAGLLAPPGLPDALRTAIEHVVYNHGRSIAFAVHVSTPVAEDQTVGTLAPSTTTRSSEYIVATSVLVDDLPYRGCYYYE